MKEHHRLLQFWRDVKGAGNPIEFALVLPVFLLLLFGTYQVWEIASIKESLDRGVLQAAEYWSTCLRESSVNSSVYTRTAERIIQAELSHNATLRYRAEKSLNPLTLQIRYYRYDVEHAQRRWEITNPAQLGDFETFLIEARLWIPWEIHIPLLPQQNFSVRTSHLAFTERPYQWPTPVPTPALITGDQEGSHAP
jgi:hypothetical protein